MRFLRLLLFLVPIGFALGQTTNQCPLSGSFSSTGASTSLDNRLKGCYNWRFTYVSTGFSALSIQLEGSPDGSTWTALTVISGDGANPATAITYATAGFHVNPSFVRVNVTAATGTGLINWQVFGTAGAAPTGTAANGGGVASVTASAPITSSGGANPNISATYQGNGGKIQQSTGTTTTNHCVKYDASGNTVDAGAACAAGTVTGVTATAPLTSSGGAAPVISATYQGNGAKVQASTGTTTTNDCVKFDVNGNTVDSGAPCSSGGSGVTPTASTFAGVGTCTTTAFLKLLTDSYYNFALCDGVSTLSYFMGGRQVALPTAASTWTVVNGASGTAAKSDSFGAVVLSTASAVLGVESLLKAIPTAPYTKILTVRLAGFYSGSATAVSGDLFACGMILANGTATSSSAQLFRLYGQLGVNTIQLASFTNYTYSGGVAQATMNFNPNGSGNLWFKIVDDNTNRAYSLSVDGANFLPIFSAARTSPFTPTHYGVFCGLQNANSGSAVLPWEIAVLSDN
jgi:hypothetical protein